MLHLRAPVLLASALSVSMATALCPGAAASGAAGDARADTLYRRALERFAQPSRDSRVAALRDFDEATRLAPGRADLWVAYGRACLESRQFARSRGCLGRAARLSGDFDSWFEVGLSWKRDWLATMDDDALDEAMKCFARATAAAPDRADGWCATSVLALLKGWPRDALEAAQRAYHADPRGAEPLLAMAAALYRSSVLALADSLFREARPRLTPEQLRIFDDESALGACPEPRGGFESGDGESGPLSRWQGTDPDLTTAENEAQLDYWTRVTLALFLFREGTRMGWDKRAELFVRYGPPAAVDYNPAEARLDFVYPRRAQVMYAPPPIPFPFNMQIWAYPELGMWVTLWDRFLVQDYELPVSDQVDFDPRPDPAALANRPELIALGAGRGVFRALAPGAKPMPITGAVSRFPTGRGVLVLAHVFAAAEPSDSVWGTWALVGSDGRTVRRESRRLSVSACDPTGRQVADFSVEVPPGDYRIDLSAGASGGRRGVARFETRADTVAGALDMSDLVLLCADQTHAVGPEGVRIEPNVEHRVRGMRAMTVYYELEHLDVGADGTSRFSYAYSIRPVSAPGKAPRPNAFEASREEENVGPHRRQFVSLPIAPLKPGEYEVTIRVRDERSGATVERSVWFEK
jgi:tetratricopeptide (TPR) repeat protein